MIEDASNDPYVDPVELKAANARHDAHLRESGISTLGRVSSGWNTAMMIRKGRLTDKVISKYEKRGFYDQDYKDARKRLMDKKSRRNGAFIERDGRLIYSPL